MTAQGPPCSAGGRAGRAPAVLSRPGAGRRADEGLRLVGESAGYAEIADAIEAVPGVVAHGLFVGVATSAVVATPDGPRILRRVRRAARARRRACGHALALASVRVGWHACCDAGRAARPPPGARGEPAAALGGARWPWRASGRAALRSPASYAGCAARGEPGAAPGDWPWNGAGWGVAWGHAGYGQGGGCSQQS